MTDGFSLPQSEYFYLAPELDTLRRHVRLGAPHGWQLDGCVDIEVRIDRAIDAMKAEGGPAPLDLYRLRRQAGDLVVEIMNGLERAGKLRPEVD
jgi:hypothetical protein